MKLNKFIKIFCICISLLILCVSAILVYFYQKREEYLFNISFIGQEMEMLKNRDMKFNNINEYNIYSTTSALFCDDSVWDKLPLSKKFLSKYKKRKDIIKNIDSYEKVFSVGAEHIINDDNMVVLTGDKKDSILTILNSSYVSTRFYFKYILNENDELDDVEFIRKVDVDSTTGKRLDGKTEIMSFPYIPYYMALFTDHRLNDEEEFKVLPIADNCTIINKPNVESWTNPKIILNEFVDKDDKNFDEIILKIEYVEGTKEWKIKFSIDKNKQFDSVEYINVD